jgi:FAD/FMN-containing dehydrogenase
MYPTLGGCLAMNVHGKNNFIAGTLGEHVHAFTALLPSGREITCSPEENRELFYAMIGGLGLLGVFTSITLKLKRVYSGNLWVKAWATPTLQAILDDIDALKAETDYIVGWMDTTVGGGALGRGQIHSANYLSPGEDPNPSQSLRVEHQTLPDTMFGLIPKSIIWALMRPFMNNLGLWGINTAKYWASRTISHQKRYLQTHTAFNFLLDYVPNWERAYGPDGMIQYQSFIPAENAHAVFTDMLRLSRKRRLPSFLSVVKRHRPDPFLLTHALDGFSLALDFRVTRSNRRDLIRLAADFDRLVLEAGGRFYFAKDSTLKSETTADFLGETTLSRFRDLKQRCDPDGLLQTDLYRRCFSL